MRFARVLLVFGAALAGCLPTVRVYDDATGGDPSDGDVVDGGDCAETECADCSGDGTCADAGCDGADCSPPACNDATKNGDETDIDCGGLSCSRCAVGQTCLINEDCANGNCSTAIGKCQ